MVKKLYWHKKQDLGVLKEELGRNNIVISSTDTIYGFLGNITQSSFNSICKLKGICQARPFLILVSHQNLINKLASFVDMSCISDKTMKFIQKCWPGTVTFLFKAKQDHAGDEKPGFLDFLSGGRETIAIRCPEHVGLQELLIDFDGLFSTSANKTGMPAPAKLENIDQDLLNNVNYVVLDQKENSGEKASTIIDLSCPDCAKDFPFGLVREGDYSLEKLQEIYKSVN